LGGGFLNYCLLTQNYYKNARQQKLKNFPSERCTKFLSFGETNSDLTVSLGCTSLYPNPATQQLLLSAKRYIQFAPSLEKKDNWKCPPFYFKSI